MTVDFEDPGAAGEDAAAPSDPTPAAGTPPNRRERIGARISRLVEAINRSDDDAVERAVLQLSASRRWLAPLAMIVGAFLMLFQGLKLLFTNWRLTLVQIVPAMWIWIAMLDIKIHLLHGKQFHVLRGPILIPCVLAVTAITAASFYLNGVFAFAISAPGQPKIRPAFGQARRHLAGHPGLGLRHRARPCLLRLDHHPLGPLALCHQPEHRGRHHDGLLPGRAGPNRGHSEDP